MVETQIKQLKSQVLEACERSGRATQDVQIVLVTKGVDSKRILEAYQTGARHFGENRVQELDSKRTELPKDVNWHLIGHLQTNKVKQVVGQVTLIHSCDRLDLAEALQKEGEKKNVSVPVLIQVNTSREATKYGFDPSDVVNAVSQIVKLNRVQILGLMTIGPFTEDKEAIRKAFRDLRELKEELKKEFAQVDWRYLSMGMSHDFEIAIEEGANILRVGTAVFGPRMAKI